MSFEPTVTFTEMKYAKMWEIENAPQIHMLINVRL